MSLERGIGALCVPMQVQKQGLSVFYGEEIGLLRTADDRAGEKEEN